MQQTALAIKTVQDFSFVPFWTKNIMWCFCCDQHLPLDVFYCLFTAFLFEGVSPVPAEAHSQIAIDCSEI